MASGAGGRAGSWTSACAALLLASALGCGAAGRASALPDAGAPAPTPASARAPAAPPQATDYARAEHWLHRPASPDKPVDVFYLYPTAWRREGPGAPSVCAVDHPGMVAGAKAAFARQATAFETVGNLFAPYYRQADAAFTLGLPPAARDEVIGGAPTADATAAFRWFLEHHNQGRPFILAGHSQGANVLLNLLAGYLQEHPEVYRRMVVAYVIGYSVTPGWLASHPHLRFAEGADDTGVIVSYNTQAPDVPAGRNPVVLPGALVINPISWTREETLAPAAAGRGSYMPVDGAFAKVPPVADARVDRAKGVLVTTADQAGLVLGFGPGIFHSYDGLFYYFDLRANAALRVEAALRRASAPAAR
jgi:hypothetical protein